MSYKTKEYPDGSEIVINKISVNYSQVNEIETDTNSFNHALNELKQRKKELIPLFNECCLKGISIQDLSTELNEEWNEIILTINGR